jgi:glutamyl-tRNA synthetase
VVVRTRFAPSPTGDLHLGGAWTALASWVWARREGGAHVLRIEDLDRIRVLRDAEEHILEDLRWLGLDWDGPVVRQSERSEVYEAALGTLFRKELIYPCDCSRADIARVASAPHEGEELVYPGTCRERDRARGMRRTPALRVRVPDEVVGFDDAIQSHFEQNLARDIGDQVLRRGDGVFSYQLAVTIDDVASHVSVVVRGADLLGSTPRQIWLARTLGAEPPRYAHVPLVVGPDGSRLEKRSRAPTIRALRESGMTPERVVGELALGLGLAETNAPVTPRALAHASAGRAVAWRTEPWRMPLSLVVR